MSTAKQEERGYVPDTQTLLAERGCFHHNQAIPATLDWERQASSNACQRVGIGDIWRVLKK